MILKVGSVKTMNFLDKSSNIVDIFFVLIVSVLSFKPKYAVFNIFFKERVTDGCYFFITTRIFLLFVCILGDFDKSVDETYFDLFQLPLEMLICQSV